MPDLNDIVLLLRQQNSVNEAAHQVALRTGIDPFADRKSLREAMKQAVLKANQMEIPNAH
jgi:hypothetical protein